MVARWLSEFAFSLQDGHPCRLNVDVWLVIDSSRTVTRCFGSPSQNCLRNDNAKPLILSSFFIYVEYPQTGKSSLGLPSAEKQMFIETSIRESFRKLKTLKRSEKKAGETNRSTPRSSRHCGSRRRCTAASRASALLTAGSSRPLRRHEREVPDRKIIQNDESMGCAEVFNRFCFTNVR